MLNSKVCCSRPCDCKTKKRLGTLNICCIAVVIHVLKWLNCTKKQARTKLVITFSVFMQVLHNVICDPHIFTLRKWASV